MAATTARWSRRCVASSSRLCSTSHPTFSNVRNMSLLPQRQQEELPFFSSPFATPGGWNPLPYQLGRGGKDKGKGKAPQPPNGEEEVDDREWEIRAARAMLHLQDSLPRFFEHGHTSADMFPPEIFSQQIVLKLPPPLPFKVSSLSAYAMAYTLARNGLGALHTDLTANLERMTFSPSPGQTSTSVSSSLLLSKKGVPAHRQRQIRALVSIHGHPRLPPHHEATWNTSSLYTISPISGLINLHEVESIRPLPGEGVADWLKGGLRGLISTRSNPEQPVPCPRSVPVPPQADLIRFLEERRSL